MIELRLSYKAHGRLRTLEKVELAEKQPGALDGEACIEIPTSILRRVSDAGAGGIERVELVFMPLVSEVEVE